jgi:ATP-dependent DNA ligase
MFGERRAPLTLVLFDVMHIDGTSTMDSPLEERKRRRARRA